MLCPLPSPQVNIVDYDGRTPLGIAASEGHVESVQSLLAHGANASINDIRCASAQARVNLWYWTLTCAVGAILDDARREKRESVVKLLGACAHDHVIQHLRLTPLAVRGRRSDEHFVSCQTHRSLICGAAAARITWRVRYFKRALRTCCRPKCS